MFIVMCRVSGGVTGTRTAPLKDRNGVALFATREEAQAEADKLNRWPRPHARASFRYWVEEDPVDAAATRMVAPDAVQHLAALVEAGKLSINEASRKAPGGWGFAWGREGELLTIWIPEGDA